MTNPSTLICLVIIFSHNNSYPDYFHIIMEPRPFIIECHSFPSPGHSIPLLKIIEILQEYNPHYKISFLSSKFFVDTIQGRHPTVKMVGIEDGLTYQSDKQGIIDCGMNALRDYVMNYHKDFYQKKSDHPDLIICDLFSKQPLLYANRHKIKCIVNNVFPYNFGQDSLSFPTFERSFGLGGLTVSYPVFFNPYKLFQGVSDLQKEIRYKHKMMWNTVIGLEEGTTVPTNHVLTGLLANRSTKKDPIDGELSKWMGGWKKQEKHKFLYVSFGTLIALSANLV